MRERISAIRRDLCVRREPSLSERGRPWSAQSWDAVSLCCCRQLRADCVLLLPGSGCQARDGRRSGAQCNSQGCVCVDGEGILCDCFCAKEAAADGLLLICAHERWQSCGGGRLKAHRRGPDCTIWRSLITQCTSCRDQWPLPKTLHTRRIADELCTEPEMILSARHLLSTDSSLLLALCYCPPVFLLI